MGQKTHPYGFRLGITRNWKSRWFDKGKTYGQKLVEDQLIKRYLKKKLFYAGVSRIEIERKPRGSEEHIDIYIYTARPALVIGKKGAEIERLKSEVEKMTAEGNTIDIKIKEVLKPELDAQLVAEGIRVQIEKRAAFRRVMNRAAEITMENGAKGVKIKISGRLGGAEIARSEMVVLGSLPLQTLWADIDYGFTEAYTTYGTIGIKVWIYKGMITEEGKSHGVNA